MAPEIAFSTAVDRIYTLGVKNTFIHVEICEPPDLFRSKTCPVESSPALDKDAASWEVATQTLCHAMALRRTFTSLVPVLSDRASEAFTHQEPASSAVAHVSTTTLLTAAIAPMQQTASTAAIAGTAEGRWWEGVARVKVEDLSGAEEAGEEATATTASSSMAEEQVQNGALSDSLSERGDEAAGSGITVREEDRGDIDVSADLQQHGESDVESGTVGWSKVVRPRRCPMRTGNEAGPRRSGLQVAAAGSSALGAQRQRNQIFSAKLPVGVEDDADFRVVKRLIGPAGANPRFIVEQCPGVKVWITGRGVTSRPAGREEASGGGPLTFCVAADSEAGLAAAVALVAELVEHVREEYQEFQTQSKAALCRHLRLGAAEGGEDKAFRAGARLIGPRGEHVKAIESEFEGVRLQILDGWRSKRQPEGTDGPEHEQYASVAVRVSAASKPSLDKACQRVETLLARLRNEYRDFAEKRLASPRQNGCGSSR